MFFTDFLNGRSTYFDISVCSPLIPFLEDIDKLSSVPVMHGVCEVAIITAQSNSDSFEWGSGAYFVSTEHSSSKGKVLLYV